MDLSPLVVVHGGAGPLEDSLWSGAMDGVRQARDRALACLQGGGRAEDAAVAAIEVMEDHPAFDAGYGSHLDQRGKVVLDAAMMRGDHCFGAVLGVERLRNPIAVARALCLDPDMLMLFGDGAESYAEALGVKLIENAALICEREQRRYEEHKQAGHSGRMSEFLRQRSQPRADTVGAVVRDRYGSLVAANSTGGTPYKRHGRVGDTPLPGCGAMAEDGIGAVVCTGWGEAIAQLLLAQRTLQSLDRLSPTDAARHGVQLLHQRKGAEGGVLCIGADGRIGVAFNTSHMPWAAVTREGALLDADSLDCGLSTP